MKTGLELLAAQLGRFAADDSGFAFDPAWGEIVGLLPVALREAVLSPNPDVPALIADCLSSLELRRCREKIEAYYLTVLRSESAPSQAERIRTNAMGLLRAALGSPGAWRTWLEGRSQAPGMRVPVAGHCAGAGFLAEIQLVPLAARPPVAVEHPELALEPLGARLLETVAAQARDRGASFLWNIVLKDQLEGRLAPLDGDSLGAALAAGVELMSRHLTYHPGCLLIARVLEGQRLARTGYEREKLGRARTAGFTRVGIAADSELTDADIDQARPIAIVRLRTVRDAADFAATRRPMPYL